jgi:DNA-binding beta-propeller fold protein YncE
VQGLTKVLGGEPVTDVQTITAGDNPSGLAIHWSNEFLYTTLENSIQELLIGNGASSKGPAAGQIFALGTPVAAVDGPRQVAIGPTNGRFVYATNSSGSSNAISEYSVNQSTGVLTPIGTATADTYPVGIAVDDVTNCAYVPAGRVATLRSDAFAFIASPLLWCFSESPV